VALAPEIDPGHVPSNYRQTLKLPAIVLTDLNIISSRTCYLSERARPGWPFTDSGLGESYGSLTNVQLPSWNHAGFGGIHTNIDRGCNCSRARWHDTARVIKSHRLFNPVNHCWLLTSGSISRRDIKGEALVRLQLTSSTVTNLGAGGAIAAMMGAFLVTYPRHRMCSLLVIFIFVCVTFIPAALLIGVCRTRMTFCGWPRFRSPAEKEFPPLPSFLAQAPRPEQATTDSVP
jgi:hypothetical protein